MNPITVIILAKNEEKNIEKCISSAHQIASRVLVIDSGSTDHTIELAKKSGAEVVIHKWLGHARQFNWALEHCNIQTQWVFRLDADESISEDLANEIIAEISSGNNHYAGYSMRWRVYFMGRWIKHCGTYKPYFLRLFRYGNGRVEERLMDEHIVVDGDIKRLRNDLIHFDYKGLDAWLSKHIWYSNLELQMYQTQNAMSNGNVAQTNRRSFYYRLPLFLRARLYFWYRYYFQLGFLDGQEGKIFCFFQAYWYRYLVDAKIYESEKEIL